MGTARQIDFKKVIIRKKLSTRGGGIEIDLTSFGYEGEKMAAYQNYLGGGMLGKVAVNDTIQSKEKFILLSVVDDLKEIGDALKKHLFYLTAGEDATEKDYEFNQRLPVSAY